jgi:two-component system NtrC family response regulator
LDEIGDASPQIQVKLLRVLETGEFMRVGGGKAIKTDVRVIAATNVDLEEAIREKTFREDLYYRLNVVRLEIPPLRARADDIPQLVEHFARQHNADIQISPAAMRLLREYGWPGNIRELANVMRRAVVMCGNGTILPEHLGTRFLPGAANAAKAAAPRTGREDQRALKDLLSQYARADLLAEMSGDELQEMLVALRGAEVVLLAAMRSKGVEPDLQLGLKEKEADTIRRALEQCRGNITETAKVLGIGRNTLYRKIRQYHLESLS